jgi:hypothetical protein
VGFLLYLNTVTCGFAYDDGQAIERNPDVLNNGGAMSSWKDVWRRDFWGTNLSSRLTHKSYRPLVVFSFRWDARVTSNPWYFHLTNAWMFATSCWLMAHYLLLMKAPANRGASVLCSGLWFAAHPIHTEAVASLVGRAEVMAAIFALAGAFVHHQPDLFRSPSSWLLAPILLLAASLCKETAVAVPVALGAVDLLSYLLNAATRTASSWIRTVLTGSASLLYLLFRSILFTSVGTGGFKNPAFVLDNFVQHLEGADKFRTAMFILASYVRLLFWPFPLLCDYSLGTLVPVTSWVSVEMVFVACIIVAVTWLVLYGLVRLQRSGDVTVLLGLGWTLLPLTPASHIVPIGTVLAERLLFLPSIGATFLVHAFLLSRNQGSFWRIVVIAVAALFAMKTVSRNKDWADTFTLFQADLGKTSSMKLLTMTAQLNANKYGNFDVAFSQAEEAQRIVDKYASVLVNAPYSVGLELMADYKTRTDGWRNANVTEALEYIQMIEAGGYSVNGRDSWSLIYRTKGTALFKMGLSSMNETIIREAAIALKLAVDRDLGSKAPSNLYCQYGTALAVLKRSETAYQAFQTCFERRKGEKESFNSERIHFYQYVNFCNLMADLSGVDTGNAGAARAWGVETIQAIEVLLSWRETYNIPIGLSTDEEKLWIQTRNMLRNLMSQ